VAALSAQAPPPRSSAQAPPPRSSAGGTGAVLITGARILDVVAGAYLPAAAVLIEQGRITSITADAPPNLADTTTRLDAKGGTLVPGLVDAHGWGAPTGDLDVSYFYLLNLAHGVTTSRVINVKTEWGVAQRGRSATWAIEAPRLSTSGRGLDQAASPVRWLFDAPDAEAARDEVARQVAAGVDWIAAYDSVTPEVCRAMADALKGTRVGLSAQPGASSMRDLTAAGARSIETLAFPTQARKGSADEAWLATPAKDLAALTTSLVRSKVMLVPMLAVARARAFSDETVKDASLELLPDARRARVAETLAKMSPADIVRAREAWASQLQFIRRFVKAGGRVATGSGFETMGYPAPGVAIHQEMAALVEAGLTPAEALRAATINGALLLGSSSDPIGLKPGVEADLFVVLGDPLNDIADLRKISTVIRGGRVVDVKDALARGRAVRVK